MNSFVNATVANQVKGRTFNNAVTLATSGHPVLDFFNAAGNRNVNLDRQFDIAHSADPKLAFRVSLWTRDIRGGAGERQTFRNLLLHFESHYADELIQMLPKIPELGRWDDVLIFKTKRMREAAYGYVRIALNAGDGLCAKWMPRKGSVAEELRRFLDLSPKGYRKTLVRLTKVVETAMCAKDWNSINFDHVPSVASARYQKAFGRNASDAYKVYKEGLVKVKEDGTTERKINAGAVYPYDVIKSIKNGDRAVATAQWNALPNLLGDDKILPIVDVSGSMYSWSYYGQRAPIKQTVMPIDISISLGLYVANKQAGAFNGMFMTFSEVPKMKQLTGDIVSMYNQMYNDHEWGMNTDIGRAFEEVLNVARRGNVPASDMPKVLLILSDMEFDSCARNPSQSAFDNLRYMYENAGYTMPRVVFWALNGRSDNSPVSFRERGTALVSGFSPAIFKSVLKADLEAYTPESVMLDTIMASRYDVPGVTV